MHSTGLCAYRRHVGQNTITVLTGFLEMYFPACTSLPRGICISCGVFLLLQKLYISLVQAFLCVWNELDESHEEITRGGDLF